MEEQLNLNEIAHRYGSLHLLVRSLRTNTVEMSDRLPDRLLLLSSETNARIREYIRKAL